MTRSQALKEAVRRWGKLAAVEDSGVKRASSPEQREAAIAQRKALLESLPDKKVRTREQEKELDALFSESYRFRYKVGRYGAIGGFRFFHVVGSGDTWEDAFSNADGRIKFKMA